MESSVKPCLVIWVRHGHRVDHVWEEGKEKKDDVDPELSADGVTQAKEAGVRIKELIEKEGYQGCQIKVVSSPFLRTLQTAAFV